MLTNPCWPRGCEPTTCCKSRQLTPSSTRACFHWRCGVGRRLTRPCVFSRNRPGIGWRSCGSGFPISFSKCCCGLPTPSATPTTRTMSFALSSRSRPRPASIYSGSSMPLTGCRIYGWLLRRFATPACSRKPPCATPATSSIRGGPSTTWSITSRSPRSWKNSGPTCWRSRTWLGCASPTPPRSWCGP